jgi:hypothetical protein
MPYGCAEPSAYIKPDCATDVFHYNRVVALGIFKVNSLGINFQLPAEWEKFIPISPDPAIYTPFSDYVNIISPVTGTYDGGEVSLVAGFGTTLEIVDSQVNTIDITAEYQPKNDQFIEDVLTGKNYGIVYMTGNSDAFYVIQQEDITIIPKTPITDELERFRRVEFSIKWSKIGIAKSVAVSDAVKALF